MPQTDERLKSYLDTNQLHREQMCLALLAIDSRFSDVRPRHPHGGPDGRRDIDAVYRNEQRAFGAVGFVNQANDSNEQKKGIGRKFKEDFKKALGSDPAPEVFLFLTNVNLTIGEKEKLTSEAKNAGFVYCEIFDRERLRISLDSPDGFSIRFQYLGLSMSESEQASFFAKWGDDIQSVISTGFQRIEDTLDRLLFLQEASNVLSSIILSFELDDTYSADEIKHFRAFCCMFLKGPKHRIFEILFGSSDKSNRMRDDSIGDFTVEKPGIKYGIGGGQWEGHVADHDEDDDNIYWENNQEYKQVGSTSSVGMDPVDVVTIRYTHDGIIRTRPRLSLRDIDQSMFMPFLNKSLAEKVKRIHMYSNGYKLQEISRCEFEIDATPFETKFPVEFSDDELSDEWVRIRPLSSSTWRMAFAHQTPKRISSPRKTPDNPPSRNQDQEDDK